MNVSEKQDRTRTNLSNREHDEIYKYVRLAVNAWLSNPLKVSSQFPIQRHNRLHMKVEILWIFGDIQEIFIHGNNFHDMEIQIQILFVELSNWPTNRARLENE